MNPIAKLLGGLWKVFIGMGLTFKNVFRRKVTIKYPYQRRPVSARYRGLFYLKWNEEKGRLNCVGCTLCAQACPTGVISMHKVGKGTTAGVDEFTMDLGRCMFCDLCVEACPFDAIYMGPAYEFAVTNKDDCVFSIVELAQGGPENAAKNIEALNKALAEAEAAKPEAKKETEEGA